MTEPASSESVEVSAGFRPCRSRTSMGRLVVVICCLLGVAVGGVFWWTFGGGEQQWYRFRLPPRAAFQGKVTLDGQPLRGGQLLTWPERRGVPKSVGFIGQGGEFLLRTDLSGNYVEEAFVGRHRVSITQYEQQKGASPPRLSSPIKYSSPDTSGLTITVDRDPAKNHVVLALTSESAESNESPPTAASELLDRQPVHLPRDGRGDSAAGLHNPLP